MYVCIALAFRDEMHNSVVLLLLLTQLCAKSRLRMERLRNKLMFICIRNGALILVNLMSDLSQLCGIEYVLTVPQGSFESSHETLCSCYNKISDYVIRMYEPLFVGP